MRSLILLATAALALGAGAAHASNSAGDPQGDFLTGPFTTTISTSPA